MNVTPREVRVAAAFEAHAAGVTALAARVLGDAEAARDVCQEAFVRLHDRLEEVRGEPGPWLRAVATRLALDRLRARSRHATAAASLARPAFAPAGDEGALEAERRDRVREALAALPDRQREVVVLRVIEGMTFPEISRDLGIHEGSAKVHLRRGIERLRSLLAPVDEEEAR